MAQGDHFTPAIPSEGPTLNSHQALIEASHNRPGRGADNDRFQLHVIFFNYLIMIKQNARKINAFFYTGFRARKVTTLYYRLIKNLPIFFSK